LKESIGVSLDLNSWFGVIITTIVCVALITLIIIVIKALKRINIKTKNLEVTSSELNVNQELLMNKFRLASGRMELLARESIRKQISYMKNTISSQEIIVRELIYNYFNITPTSDLYNYNIIWLVVEGLINEVVYTLATNITDNHVGKTEEALSEYSRLRAKEYMAFTKWYLGDKRWCTPELDLMDAINNAPEQPETYIYKVLLELFKNCKSLRDSVRCDSIHLDIKEMK
jgi:hypothetical protein